MCQPPKRQGVRTTPTTTASTIFTMNKGGSDRLSRVPSHRRIRLVHVDKDILVIDKPCNLRSVPGHAHPPPTDAGGLRKRPRLSQSNDALPGDYETTARDDIVAASQHKRTAQEAWECAIRTFANNTHRNGDNKQNTGEDHSQSKNNKEQEEVLNCLRRLGASKNLLASVPRKQKLFLRYIQRNQKRIFECTLSDEKIQQMASQMFLELQPVQKSFLSLPEPTLHEDSAYGQLVLMGYDADDHGSPSSFLDDSNETKKQNGNGAASSKLFIVHRLDMETSGIMVFARNEPAASSLCQAWREREGGVSKIYLAKVKQWPPFHCDNLVEGHIDVPLAPSEERLKWKVVDSEDPNGKPSQTMWWIVEDDDDTHVNTSSSKNTDQEHQQQQHPIVLKLQPLTGRTHQLRVHCAHVGSGIIGDSLYGEDPLDYLGQDGKRLLLHAHTLSFKHPSTNERLEFSAPPQW